jgi:ERO1-like protein beta
MSQRHQLPGCYYRDSDFCFIDDNTGALNVPCLCRCLLLIRLEGDYFDLSLVPERFTGYAGPDAHRIWRSIYEENCFGLSELTLLTGKSPAPDSMSEVFRDNENGHEEHCLEKRVYYKIISGKLNSCIRIPTSDGAFQVCMLRYLHTYVGNTSTNLLGNGYDLSFA